jgi:thiosulfate dehydrogenase (quinone) large subunit
MSTNTRHTRQVTRQVTQEPTFRQPQVSTSPSTSPSTAGAWRYVAGATRLSLGWIFLWAFLDKLFALGFATGRDAKTGAIDAFGPAAWIHGGSPTQGFLKFATAGPLASFYQSFAGAAWADWLFMIGLAGIGLALVLGVGMRIATVSGVAMLVMMWSAALWPANNPFMDEHLVYALVLVMLLLTGAGKTLGLGRAWERLHVVQRHPILK